MADVGLHPHESAGSIGIQYALQWLEEPVSQRVYEDGKVNLTSNFGTFITLQELVIHTIVEIQNIINALADSQKYLSADGQLTCIWCRTSSVPPRNVNSFPATVLQ